MFRPFRSPVGALFVILCASQVVGWSDRRETIGLPKDRLAAISAEIESTRAKLGIPGLTVTLIRDGERWTKGFGFADLEHKVPAKPETVYRLASISKPITAVALMRLVERGKFDLDADIRTYVPSFPEKKWKATPRQLLAHLGGVRSYRGAEVSSTKHYTRVVDGLEMFRDDPLESKPGSRYHYSTYGYNLLGAAVETASGEAYMEFVRKHVFAPTGMTKARDDDSRAIIPDRARGYRKAPDGSPTNCVLADTSNKIPGGGLAATSEDVAAFGAAFLAGKLVDRATMDLMLTEQKTDEGKGVGYGFGWNLGRDRGARVVSHSGGQPGTSTLLHLRPKSRLSIAILSNLEGADFKPLAKSIAERIEAEEAKEAAAGR